MGKYSKEKGSSVRNRVAAIVAMATAGGVGSIVMAPTANAATIPAWDKIAQCEAGGDWSINHSSDGLSVGGLQFQNPSWQDALAYLRSKGYDTSSYPQRLYQGMPRSSVPTKYQQIIAGEALLALQGPRAWVCNAMVGYPLQSAWVGTNSSMFKGGANPYPGGSPTPAPAPAPSPGATTHTVVSGDTLYSIALKYLGNGERWPEIYDLNKTLIGPNPDNIEVGMVLKLPVTKYTVVSGDTLYGIAVKLGFGTADDNWKPIYEANKALIGPDPNLIQPGQVLTIPPKPTTTTSTSTASTTSSATYVKPVEGRVGDGLIVGSGGSMSRTAGGHSGLDISAPSGTPVKAVAAGSVVSKNASGAAYGNHVVIKHKDGKFTLYAHLSSTAVNVGQTVNAGQLVGRVGSTGHSSGPHLHFEVRTHPTNFGAGVFLNPLAYLRSHGVAL